jgi:hypothetical protein
MQRLQGIANKVSLLSQILPASRQHHVKLALRLFGNLKRIPCVTLLSIPILFYQQRFTT